MADGRVWDSESERLRKAAYRQRKRRAAEPLRVQGLSEEQYVARELALTARLYPDDPARLARSERYLRWRFHGVAAGEVAQL
jgi:hypothetical protein